MRNQRKCNLPLLAALILVQVGGSSALGQEQPIIVGEPSHEVGVFIRPTALDADRIRYVARVGAQQQVTFRRARASPLSWPTNADSRQR